MAAEFPSILFDRLAAEEAGAAGSPPECFPDLNLDQVVAAIVAGREEYRLEPWFHTLLPDAAAVEYRQETMRDLAAGGLRSGVEAFAADMRLMRRHLAAAGQAPEALHRDRHLLDAAAVYCRAVASLREALAAAPPAGRALGAFRDALERYAAAAPFAALSAGTAAQSAALASVEYNVHVDAGQVTVSRYTGEAEYRLEIEEAFARFRQGAGRSYRIAFREPPSLDVVEARIFESVVKLFPRVFADLERYCRRHMPFLEEGLERFDREVQFYLSVLGFLVPLQDAGLAFCYPQVSGSGAGEHARGAFDLALAAKLGREGSVPVCNDFRLDGPERVIVVTGPNQGGKTTFARMFGQLHYLAALGCPVPGEAASLPLVDRVLTHFEQAERVEDQRGKLEDELLRARHLLEQATAGSVVIMNEGFTSTTLQDARFIGARVLEQVVARGARGVYVTFVDDLAALGTGVVSMVAQVDPEDPSLRTFRVVREPASGQAHAAAIAAKYGLGYERLRERLAP